MPTPTTGTVPSVLGSNQAVATSSITGAGFTVGTVRTTTAGATAGNNGQVVSQSATGAAQPLATPINLVLYSYVAPTTGTVPSVLGSNQAVATSSITGAGFTVGTVRTTTAGATAGNNGQVVTQSATGAAQLLATPINLVLYSYVAPTPTPPERVTVRELIPGESAATENGVTIPTKVELLSDGNGQSVSGEGWNIAISGSEDAVYGIVQGPDIKTVLIRGISVTTSGEGFKPGTLAKVFLFPTPILLGEAIVKADGTFFVTYPVSATISLGNNTMEVDGTTFDGKNRKVDVGLEVRASREVQRTLLNSLRYGVNISNLNSVNKAKLRAVAVTTRKMLYRTIWLYGYTDAQTGVDNVALSKARALKAKTNLQKLLPKTVIRIKYFAAANPASKGKSKAAYAQNRRVEVYGSFQK
jgi:outer membrane protein OmpA-like peptidoglycan-associated protein